jgi:hypothetical protein
MVTGKFALQMGFIHANILPVNLASKTECNASIGQQIQAKCY